MAIEEINTGSGDNKGNGETLRSAFTKINANFLEIKNVMAPINTPPLHSYGAVGDKKGMIAFDAENVYYCLYDYDALNPSRDIWVRTSWLLDTW